MFVSLAACNMQVAPRTLASCKRSLARPCHVDAHSTVGAVGTRREPGTTLVDSAVAIPPQQDSHPTMSAYVPDLTPLAAPQTEKERRERQRLHVKRAYYRRLNEMQALRSQVRQLEDHFAQLVVQRQEAEARHWQDLSTLLATDTDEHAHDGVEGRFSWSNEANWNVFSTSPPAREVALAVSPGLESLRELYTEISQVKEQLLAQNETLRVSLDELERSALRMRELVEIEALSPSLSHEVEARPTPTLREPVTLAFCDEITRAKYQEVLALRRSQGYVTTGVSVFGWRDKRLRYGDRLKFSLNKWFYGITPMEMWMRGWRVLSSPESMAALFSPSTNTRIWTLQRVDENNLIFYREMSSPDGAVVIKTPVLATRFTTPTGFMIMVHSVSPGLVEATANPPGVMEKWIEHNSWVTFESGEGQEGHCLVEYSGDVQSNPLVSTGLWMVELLCIILRWDMAVVGPIFSLC